MKQSRVLLVFKLKVKRIRNQRPHTLYKVTVNVKDVWERQGKNNNNNVCIAPWPRDRFLEQQTEQWWNEDCQHHAQQCKCGLTKHEWQWFGNKFWEQDCMVHGKTKPIYSLYRPNTMIWHNVHCSVWPVHKNNNPRWMVQLLVICFCCSMTSSEAFVIYHCVWWTIRKNPETIFSW